MQKRPERHSDGPLTGAGWSSLQGPDVRSEPSSRRATAPTLVIHGDRDPLVYTSGGLATAKAIPWAQQRTIKGIGHEIATALSPQLAALIADHIQGEERPQ